MKFFEEIVGMLGNVEIDRFTSSHLLFYLLIENPICSDRIAKEFGREYLIEAETYASELKSLDIEFDKRVRCQFHFFPACA